MSSRSSDMRASFLAQHTWLDSPQQPVNLPPLLLVYRTDALCSRGLLKQILPDYLENLYPLLPVVHRPSFRHDLAHDRDTYDNDFLALILCISAATVGTMPSLFRKYQSSGIPTRFQSRTEMINRCYELASELRGPDYFDKFNFQKWAASYLISIALFQIGQINRSRMIEVEYMQLARLLEIHRITRYRGLNRIESQLRKKAFWLIFYGYVHDQLQNLRRERLKYLDEQMLTDINLDELMPLEVDDEAILEHEVLPHNPGQIPVTAGFTLHSRVFWTAFRSIKTGSHSSECPELCACVRSKEPDLQLAHLRRRLSDLKYMLDVVPSPLRPWTAAGQGNWLVDEEGEPARILDSQFTSMRANLHVTHLWLQSTILDHIDALLLAESRRPSAAAGMPAYEPKATWMKREDICRQLLHILHSIPDINLESNGHHLTFKIRDVAVTLLSCPFEPHEEVARRAHEYLLEFSNKLSRLDGSEILNTTSLQSWVDTVRSPGDD